MSSRLSIKERLQGVSTEEQLDGVMRELWAFGSPNWTFDTTIRFLPSNLWGALDKYFDRSGRLVARFPGRQGPGDQIEAPLAEVDDDVHMDLPGDGWLRTGSLSDLIASFHDRLEEIRRENRPVVRVVATRVESAEPGEPDVPAGSRESDEPELVAHTEPKAEIVVAVALDPEPAVEETGLLCPICLQRRAELVDFRGKDVCRPCVQLLRGY